MIVFCNWLFFYLFHQNEHSIRAGIFLFTFVSMLPNKCINDIVRVKNLYPDLFSAVLYYYRYVFITSGKIAN